MKPSSKIFLGGLRYTETEHSVQNHFKQFGTIQSIQLPKEKTTGKPRGFGFVTFKEEGVAQKLAANKAHVFNGRFLDIKLAIPRTDNDASIPVSPVHSETTPHVVTTEKRNKEDRVGTEDEVVENQHCQIQNSRLQDGSESLLQDSPVYSSAQETGEESTKSLHKTVTGGTQSSHTEEKQREKEQLLHHQREPTKQDRKQTFLKNRIFVGGLPDGATNSVLREYFSYFGTVIDSFVLLHAATRRPRGFGFVTFKSEEVVPDVLAYQKHVILGKKVETRLATTRSEKKIESPGFPEHSFHHFQAGHPQSQTQIPTSRHPSYVSYSSYASDLSLQHPNNQLSFLQPMHFPLQGVQGLPPTQLSHPWNVNSMNLTSAAQLAALNQQHQQQQQQPFLKPGMAPQSQSQLNQMLNVSNMGGGHQTTGLYQVEDPQGRQRPSETRTDAQGAASSTSKHLQSQVSVPTKESPVMQPMTIPAVAGFHPSPIKVQSPPAQSQSSLNSGAMLGAAVPQPQFYTAAVNYSASYSPTSPNAAPYYSFSAYLGGQLQPSVAGIMPSQLQSPQNPAVQVSQPNLASALQQQALKQKLGMTQNMKQTGQTKNISELFQFDRTV